MLSFSRTGVTKNVLIPKLSARKVQLVTPIVQGRRLFSAVSSTHTQSTSAALELESSRGHVHLGWLKQRIHSRQSQTAATAISSKALQTQVFPPELSAYPPGTGPILQTVAAIQLAKNSTTRRLKLQGSPNHFQNGETIHKTSTSP